MLICCFCWYVDTRYVSNVLHWIDSLMNRLSNTLDRCTRVGGYIIRILWIDSNLVWKNLTVSSDVEQCSKLMMWGAAKKHTRTNNRNSFLWSCRDALILVWRCLFNAFLCALNHVKMANTFCWPFWRSMSARKRIACVVRYHWGSLFAIFPQIKYIFVVC